jgi:hypothetical protein
MTGDLFAQPQFLAITSYIFVTAVTRATATSSHKASRLIGAPADRRGAAQGAAWT